jgi:hypothetical protein
MARAGRDLERLVAVLEELLRPEGLLIRSPDRLRDTITGTLREVDASIRASEDGPVIAVCECRDRAGVEDVTWVEQVVTKGGTWRAALRPSSSPRQASQRRPARRPAPTATTSG